MREKDIKKEVDKTLNALNGHQRVAASPYFYTKLQQRLDQATKLEEKATFSLVRLWQPALLSVLLFVNIFTLSELRLRKDKVSVLAGEYNIAKVENEIQDYSIGMED
jgi:hypothetical protein